MDRGAWSLVTYLSFWIVLLSLLVIHGSFAAYRSMQMMSEPYGTGNATLALVVYYTLMVCIVAAFVLSDPHRLSWASVMHRATVLYLLAWLALVPQFFDSVNIIFMVLLSAFAFVRQSDFLLRDIFLHNWRPLTAVWCLTTLASGWFFAFYTLAEYINSRWPGHPSQFFIELFALFITWAVGSMEPFVREHYVQDREVVRKLAGDPRLAQSVSTTAPTSFTMPLAYMAVEGGGLF